MVRGGLVAVDGLAGLHVDLMVQLSYVAGGGKKRELSRGSANKVSHAVPMCMS